MKFGPFLEHETFSLSKMTESFFPLIMWFHLTPNSVLEQMHCKLKHFSKVLGLDLDIDSIEIYFESNTKFHNEFIQKKIFCMPTSTSPL